MARASHSATPPLRSLVHRPQGVILVRLGPGKAELQRQPDRDSCFSRSQTSVCKLNIHNINQGIVSHQAQLYDNNIVHQPVINASYFISKYAGTNLITVFDNWFSVRCADENNTVTF